MSAKKKPAKPTVKQGVEMVKVTLSIPKDVEKRFALHASMADMGRGEFFAELVRSGCRRYVISDREAKASAEAGEEQGGGLAAG